MASVTQQWVSNQADDGVTNDPSSHQQFAVSFEPSAPPADGPDPSASLARAQAMEALAISLEGVRGSDANYIQALIFMVVSLVAALAGLAAVDANASGGGSAFGGLGGAKAVFAFAALLFISSGLGLSKAVRDRSFADAFALASGAGPAGALRMQLRGSQASLYAAVFGAAASLCMACASVLLLNGSGSSANHLFGTLAFCLTSTVTVAKVVRDRFDADFIESCGLTAGTAQLARLMRVADGLIGGTQLFFWLSFGAALASVATVLGIVLASGLGAETKTIVSVCVVLLAVAAINASKMVRDKLDRSRGAAQNSQSWNAITTISFVVAVVAAAFGSFWICNQGVLSASMCAFTVTGMLWVLASVLTFSKVARDHEERGRLLAPGGGK